jgi:hypothetical protein
MSYVLQAQGGEKTMQENSEKTVEVKQEDLCALMDFACFVLMNEEEINMSEELKNDTPDDSTLTLVNEKQRKAYRNIEDVLY